LQSLTSETGRAGLAFDRQPSSLSDLAPADFSNFV
jgi:hypothetical protein